MHLLLFVNNLRIVVLQRKLCRAIFINVLFITVLFCTFVLDCNVTISC